MWRGGATQGRSSFTQLTYTPSLHLLNLRNKFCHTCPALHAKHTFQYTVRAFLTEITDTALIKRLFCRSERHDLNGGGTFWRSFHCKGT